MTWVPQIGFILIIILLLVPRRYLYNYRIANESIQIVIFKVIPVRRLLFNNISEIRKISRKEISWNPFESEKWGNRLFGDIVLVRKKSGLIKSLLITPDDADAFIKEAQKHIAQTDRRGTGDD